jgi:hypothetical protein
MLSSSTFLVPGGWDRETPAAEQNPPSMLQALNLEHMEPLRP